MSQLMAGSEDNTSGQPEVLALGFIAERRPQPWTEDMLRDSLRHKRATLAKSHLSTAMTLAILGQDLLSNQKPQDAESILRESLAMRREALPKDNWLIAETESLLGECMLQLNQFEEAETFLVKSFQVVENSVDLVPAIKLEFVQRICTLYEQWGKHEQNSAWQIQLEKLLRACLFDWKESAGANEQLVMATELRLGECIGTLGRYEEAEEMLLKSYALLCFNSGWSGDPYWVGKAASKRDECRQSLNRLYQQWKQPDELSRWQKLVSLLPSQGENASVECHLQGIAIWKQVCNRYPNSLFQVRFARAHSDLGLAYFRIEQFQESLLCFQKSIDQLEVVLAGDPQIEWALEHLGATQASMGDTLRDLQRNSEALAAYEKAAAIAKRLTTDGSDNLPGTKLEAKRVPIKLAMFLANCPDAAYRDPGRAIKTVREAEDLKADQGMLLARGLALYHSGDWQAVIESHKQMLPGRPEALVVAMAYERLGEHEKARFYYDTSVARYQNALILSGWRESREPKQLFRQASEVLGINANQRDAIAAHWRGIALVENGQPAAATESFRKAIDLKPDYAEPYMGLSIALGGIKPPDPEAATAAIEKFFSLNPKNPSAKAYVILGSLLGQKGEIDASIDALKQAIELEPNFGWAYSDLGSSLSVKGNYGESISAYEKAVELLPDAIPRRDLAWLLATCADHVFRNPKRAVELAIEASQLAPNNSENWKTLGVARYRNGNFQEAIDALKKSVELASDGGGIDFLFLALAHWQLGDKDQAQHWYKEGTLWIDQNQPVDKELERILVEAAALLDVAIVRAGQ